MAGAVSAPAAPAGANTSGDTFTQAQTDINSQRAQMLAAMAQAGTAGKAAYDQAIGAAQQQKQDAIGQALRAATQGESQATLAQMQGLVSAPYDRTAADLGAAAASRQASMADREGQASSYMNEALAAVPAMRNQAEMNLAGIRAKAAQQAATQAMDLQLKQMSLAESANRLARSSAGGGRAGGGLTPYQEYEIAQAQAKAGQPAAIIAAQGGEKTLGNLLFHQGGGFAKAQTPANVFANPGALLLGQSGGRPDAATWENDLGQSLGLDAGQGAGLAGGSPDAQRALSDDALRLAQGAIGQKAARGNPFGIPAGQTIAAGDVLPIIASNYGLTIANQIATLYGKGGSIVTPARGG